MAGDRKPPLVLVTASDGTKYVFVQDTPRLHLLRCHEHPGPGLWCEVSDLTAYPMLPEQDGADAVFQSLAPEEA